MADERATKAPTAKAEPAPSPNLAQRLSAVMAEVGYVQKGGKTESGAIYKYVKHDQVVALIRPALVKHGVFALDTVPPESVSCVEVGQTKSGATRWKTTLELHIVWMNIDDPGDAYEVSFPGEGVDTDDKGTGKALSYALKNCLLKTFMIESGDEADNEATGDSQAQAAPKARQARPKSQEGPGAAETKRRDAAGAPAPGEKEALDQATSARRFWGVANKEGISKEVIHEWFARNLKVQGTKTATVVQLRLATQWALGYAKSAQALKAAATAAGLDANGVANEVFRVVGEVPINELTLEEWATVTKNVNELADSDVPFGEDALPEDEQSLLDNLSKPAEEA